MMTSPCWPAPRRQHLNNQFPPRGTCAFLRAFPVSSFMLRPARLLSTTYLLVLLAPCLNATIAVGQAPDTGWQIRPKLVADIELIPRTRLQIWGELQDGVNYSFQRWRAGAMLDRRMRPILRPHKPSIDEENNHYLVFGAGYEYLHTIQNGRSRRESRIIVQATPNYAIPGNFLLSDRNRVQLRWANGVYDFRYENRLMIQRPLEAGNFKFTPYVSGEIRHDRDRHSWDESRYGFGVQFPYQKRLMVDTYLLHQNCPTCSQTHDNMVGITLNLYFRRPK